MRTFNDERMILDSFKYFKKICYFGNVNNIRKITRLLKNVNNSKQWINTSGKNDPPPDFYNKKHQIMMDVMRVDDCAYVDKRGKVQNKTLQKEGEIKKAYFDYPDSDNIDAYIITSSGLKTDEDHNFKRYCDNFKRVFKNHESKLELYQRNHPGYKTIFFIFDESTAYQQVENKQDLERIKEGNVILSQPHFAFIDKYFIDILKNSKVDYVVWLTPWKLVRYVKNGKIKIFPMPQCAIYSIRSIPDISREYDHKMIKSLEE